MAHLLNLRHANVQIDKTVVDKMSSWRNDLALYNSIQNVHNGDDDDDDEVAVAVDASTKETSVWDPFQIYPIPGWHSQNALR